MMRSVLRVICLMCWLAPAAVVTAHPGGHGAPAAGEGGADSAQRERLWKNDVTGERYRGSLLLVSGGWVKIEQADGRIVSVRLEELGADDQRFARDREAQIARWNRQPGGASAVETRERGDSGHLSGAAMLCMALLLMVLLTLPLMTARMDWRRLAVMTGCLLAVVSGYGLRRQAQGARPATAAPFDAFAPTVRTSFDSRYLYVESNGIPDHQMMVGIKAWQQQVPIPQPYFSDNAWSIPLNPVVAAQPISAKTALFTGAIALAANGVPIFNALNNRGVDSFSIGELDEFGGHCGRADDYHYHAAPLHIQSKVGPGLPIGYALDGFPLYGLSEPDGSPATGLDELNGHYDQAGKYHYHSTKTYPYINGGMRGVVTVSNDQIVPQPRAWSARPFTSPLSGAVITGFRTLGPKSWSLEYKINNQVYYVNYSVDSAGKYIYEFVDPAGTKRTETYTRKGLTAGVSAASYSGEAVAAESIVSIFGTGLASATRSATATPLPTDLGGTVVRVIDSSGASLPAPIFFVSPTQINCEIPPGASPGKASLTIGLNGALAGFGELTIGTVAPGIFTADASGQGYPAASIYRYRSGVLVGTEAVTRFDAALGKVVAVPIDPGAETDTLFLVLFGTGLRYRSSLSGVVATIGGTDAQVLYAGAQGGFVGLDQINLRLPSSLRSRSGDVDVVLTIDGRSSNTVRVNLKGGAATSVATWSMLKLPDTGQTGHYGSVFGEDSDYTINPPALRSNGDGSLTDTVTGLQWQQGDGGEMTWDGARSYCDGLVLAGRDDWRLPRMHEAFSVLNHNVVNPATDAGFTRTGAEYWWTSELRADDATRAWATNAGGGAGPHQKSETLSAGGTKKFQARCVRDATTGLALAEVFRDNLDGTVTDRRTELSWLRTDVASQTWDEAVRYCENLTFAGAGDWRLPNVRELVSILDQTRVRPALDPTAFPGAPSALFWSSTTLVNQTTRSWTIDYTLGIISYNLKTDRLRLRCVRGGTN